MSNIRQCTMIKCFFKLFFSLNLIFSTGISIGLSKIIGNSIFKICDFVFLISVYIINFYMIYKLLAKRKLYILRYNRGLILLLTIMLLIGTINSINIYRTYKGIIYWYTFLCFSIFITEEFDSKAIFLLIKRNLLITLYLNLMVLILFKDKAFSFVDTRFDKSFIGLFGHKSSCSIFLVLVIITLIIDYRKNSIRKKLAINIHIITALFLLCLCNSVTSIIILIVSAIYIVLIYLYGNNKINVVRQMVLINIIFYIIVILGQSLNEILIETIGRDLSLTGRIKIWQTIINFIKNRPIIGYGYDAIWTTDNFSKLIQINTGFKFTGTHNGWLDLILQLGFLGFGIFAIVMFVIPGIKMKKINSDKKMDVFISIFYVYLMLYMITESSFGANYYQSFICMIIICYLNKNNLKEISL